MTFVHTDNPVCGDSVLSVLCILCWFSRRVLLYNLLMRLTTLSLHSATDSATTISGNVQRQRLRNVNLWLINIRGLRSNIGQLQARIYLTPPPSKPDLILIAESKLDRSVPDDSSHINTNGYSQMRRDRSDDSGGVVILSITKMAFL